jgi:hypothetical protein
MRILPGAPRLPDPAREPDTTAPGRTAGRRRPTLRALLAAEEVQRVSVVRQRNSVVLAVTARGEESLHHLWLPNQVGESAAELRNRVGSELQDAVAESRIARCELRPWPPAAG